MDHPVCVAKVVLFKNSHLCCCSSVVLSVTWYFQIPNIQYSNRLILSKWQRDIPMGVDFHGFGTIQQWNEDLATHSIIRHLNYIIKSGFLETLNYVYVRDCEFPALRIRVAYAKEAVRLKKGS